MRKTKITLKTAFTFSCFTLLSYAGISQGCPPSFTTAATYTVGANLRDILTADFNGDNNLDLVTTNKNMNTVSIMLGSPSGVFGTPTSFSVGIDPFQVDTGDFNTDGKLDLAVCNEGSSFVSILNGTGSGAFTQGTDFTVDAGITALICRDFNGDGKTDLVVSSKTTWLTKYYVGDGAGGFTAQGGTGNSSYPVNFSAGYFNNDAYLDLVLTDASSAAQTFGVLLNGGPSGQFSNLFYTDNNISTGVTTGDFDEDGITDIIQTHPGGYGFYIWLGAAVGNGTFAMPSTFYNYSSPSKMNNPWDIISGDFNNDGKLDVVTANKVGNNISLLPGIHGLTYGTEFFNTSSTVGLSDILDYDAGTAPVALTKGDFNKDGKLDIAVANNTSMDVSVFLNNSAGVPIPTVTASSSVSMICIGESVTLSGGGADIYIWSNSVIDGTPFMPTSTKTYTVTGINTTSNCYAKASITVTVNALPTINVGGNIRICSEQNFLLTASGGVNYVWSTGSTNSSISIIPTTLTNYSVSMTSYSVTGTDMYGCVNSAFTTFTVVGLPDISTSLSAGILSAVPAIGAQFQWVFCPNYTVVPGPNAQNENFSVTQDGDYAVIVTRNGCPDTSSCTNVIISGINENGQNSNIKIFPNPANDNLFIQTAKITGTIEVALFDVTGQEVYLITSAESFLRINLAELAKGFYIIRIASEKDVLQQRLIKQ